MKKPSAVAGLERAPQEDILEVIFDADDSNARSDAELAPLQHFHREQRARTLRTGPLANPRRTRLS